MRNLHLECFRCDGRNGVHSIQVDEFIDEIDYFAVCLHSSSRLSITDLVIFITDFPFELEERFSDDRYVYFLSEKSLMRYFREEGFDYKDYTKKFDDLRMSKLFVNYPIGLSEIQLYNEKSETVILEFKVNIISDKLNEGEFVSLVNYIESKSIALWAQYSLLKNEASPNENINKNDWQLLYLQRFIEEFSNKLYFFEYDKLTVYKKDAQVVAYSSVVVTDEDSIYWLGQNLDILQSTNSADSEKIVIRNRLFRPKEILTSTTHESTDILENKFVHGFIDELISFLSIQMDHLKSFSLANRSKSFQDILYFYSQKRKYRLYNEFLKKLESIKSYMLEFIPVSETILGYIPTHRINSKDHYQLIYERFVEWFSYDRVNFSDNKSYFKGVTRMDKLFERACLYKLIDLFISMGYKCYVERKVDGLPQVIQFKQEQTNRFHTMYFEIYPDRFETQNKGWTLKPDFFIEFDNNRLLILDAKYKKNSTVQKYDWERLTLKYLHGIGYKNGGNFNPTALFALIPSSNNQTEFYQNRKYDLISQTPALPSIGSLIVDFEGNSSDLEKYMLRILELIY